MSQNLKKTNDCSCCANMLFEPRLKNRLLPRELVLIEILIFGELTKNLVLVRVEIQWIHAPQISKFHSKESITLLPNHVINGMLRNAVTVAVCIYRMSIRINNYKIQLNSHDIIWRIKNSEKP